MKTLLVILLSFFMGCALRPKYDHQYDVETDSSAPVDNFPVPTYTPSPKTERVYAPLYRDELSPILKENVVPKSKVIKKKIKKQKKSKKIKKK